MKVSRWVTLALLIIVAGCSGGGGNGLFAAPVKTTFQLKPNPAFLSCLAAAGATVTAKVEVVQGNLNDQLTLTLDGVKPNLAFDLFTVERSNLNSDGTVNPAFTNFGLAWYQSDIEANGSGHAEVTIQTILLNQIFGFDPDAALAPTNTFHVGFWFNDPNDAAACGFNPAKPTPFNGQHQAGPLAMISVPDATTDLGPLCLNPDTSTTPATCNP
jgi:hypothetical protein